MPKAALNEQLADLKLQSSQAFVRTSSQSPLNCRPSSPVTNAEVDESLQDDKLRHWQQVKRNHGVIAAFGSRRSKGMNHFRPQRKNISTFSELHEKGDSPGSAVLSVARSQEVDGGTVWRYVKWESLQATVSLLVISQPVPEAEAANHRLTSISSGIADKNAAQLQQF